MEQLNKAKTKAVNHISHELKTPLSVIQGSIRLLKRKLIGTPLFPSLTSIIDTLERNTERLLEIFPGKPTKFSMFLRRWSAGILLGEFDRLFERMQNLSEAPEAIRMHWEALKEWTSKYLSGSIASFQSMDLYPSVLSIVEKIKEALPGTAIFDSTPRRTGSYCYGPPHPEGSYDRSGCRHPEYSGRRGH